MCQPSHATRADWARSRNPRLLLFLASTALFACARRRFESSVEGAAGTLQESAFASTTPQRRHSPHWALAGSSGPRGVSEGKKEKCLHRRLCAAPSSEVLGSFEQRREALKRCLAREYTSFFRPFEADFYSEDVTFKDPLTELSGKVSYKKNIDMLSGESLVGNILFSDGYIDLHAVEEVPGDLTRLRTRWTLGFVFKLLPWKPQAIFTGISEYVIDASTASVLSQRDYWDTLSLGQAGSYAPEAALAGLQDLVMQFLPASLQPAEARQTEEAEVAGWSLLRRARAYRVYRGSDGKVFAVAAPGFASGLEGVERELKVHGLSVAGRMPL
ncbi:unnamed protein product, partial [Polarella glacialis]